MKERLSCSSSHCKLYLTCEFAAVDGVEPISINYHDHGNYNIITGCNYECGPLNAYKMYNKVDPKRSQLPHTHTDPVKNEKIIAIIDSFNNLVSMAKMLGYDIKLHPDSKQSLELYFHDDYPGIILVDKYEP